MRKEVGASAGLLALLALFLHTQLPSQENNTTVERGEHGSSAKPKKSSDSKDREEQVEGPWLATQAVFHVGTSTPDQRLLDDLTSPDRTPPDEKLSRLLGLPKSNAPEMFSVVATVADPSHTRMALLLDGETEAIERSVQASGWDFAAQWLPWGDRFDGNEPDINARRSLRRMQRQQENLPGILVFRAAPDKDQNRFPNKILVVFLVPETVTGGINGPAFYAAMHLAKPLSAKEHKKLAAKKHRIKHLEEYNPVGLLAPSFSGSFPSLSKLVGSVKEAKAKGFPHLRDTVYGGTVSNLQYARAFAEETGLNFHGGVHNSEDYQEVFCKVLEKYNMNDGRAAVLKEDEGGLKQSMFVTECEDKRYQTYYFPREISSLRNAYQEVSGGAANDPYVDQPGRVNFSIRDPNSGEDSIPTFSETQTPLTQDTILSSITDELNRSHTHVVFLSVTNPLDALFLLQALHAACPDTRVFIQGPSVLFVSAAARQALAGTLFLSPYPQFFEGDDWLKCAPDNAAGTCKDSPVPERLMFAESTLQGLYNVTQFLLTDMAAVNVNQAKLEKTLRGYSQPGRHEPGMWVLTLNRFGFLPIDLISPSDLNRSSKEWSTIHSNQADQPWFKRNQVEGTSLPTALDPLLAPLPWMITVLSISIAILIACFLFVRCNISRHRAKPLWLVFSDGYAPRFEALLCACLSLTALEWTLALPWGLSLATVSEGERWRVVILKLLVLLGLGAPLLTLLFTLYLFGRRWARKRVRIEKLRIRDGVYYGTPLLLFGFAVWDWSYLCNRHDTGLFFRFRALELYSGSSPALPLALVCLIFFCISLSHLKQYALAGLARPTLEIRQDLSAMGYVERFRAAYESIGQRISAPWKLEKRCLGYRIAVAVMFVLFCFVILGLSSTNAFELQRYNLLLAAAVVAILLCLATKWYDLLMLWGCVNKLLKLIQVPPLQPAIQRIAKNWPKRSIWAFNRSVSNEAVDREMLYALHRRALSLKYSEENAPKATMAAAAASGGSKGFAGENSAAASRSGEGETPSPEKIQPMTYGEAENDRQELLSLVYGPSKPASAPAAKPAATQILTGEADPTAFEKLLNIEEYQKVCARLAAKMYTRELLPAWRTSLNIELEKPAEISKMAEVDTPESVRQKYVEYCADFVALRFCRFIAYAVAQVKRMATSVSIIFVLLVLVFNSYSPEGSQRIGRFLCALFLVLGFAYWRVFSQMERNPILSTIAHTTPGELSGEFWLQLLALGGLPLLGVLGRLFPSVSQFLFQWIAPSVQGAH